MFSKLVLFFFPQNNFNEIKFPKVSTHISGIVQTDFWKMQMHFDFFPKLVLKFFQKFFFNLKIKFQMSIHSSTKKSINFLGGSKNIFKISSEFCNNTDEDDGLSERLSGFICW